MCCLLCCGEREKEGKREGGLFGKILENFKMMMLAMIGGSLKVHLLSINL